MAGAYRNQPWNKRFGQMGDAAEHVFEQVRPLGPTIRFGWNRPEGVSVTHMPPVLRHTPDYYSDGSLVEVVGLGRDGILKLKVSKYDALKIWNQLLAEGDEGGECLLFVWNSAQKEWALLSWETIKKLVAKARRKGIEEFFDGNAYFPILWEDIKEQAEWVDQWADHQ